jgi:uncharacterized 2Fe-2S/4Fe-4S cluster protein (DUF4445 family)
VSYTINLEPVGIRLLCEEPLTISEAIRRAGIRLRSECGGKGVCGKCQVQVDGGGLLPLTEAEQKHLNPQQIAERWRLACRTVISSDATIFVPPGSLTEDQVIQTESLEVPIAPAPAVRQFSLAVSAPSLSDQSADLARVSKALLQQHQLADSWANPPALRMLSRALRESGWKIDVALRGSEIIGAYPPSHLGPVGLAVDVGTTKLACYLVDLNRGQTLAAKGVMNPQIAHGEDVMSRLEAVMVDADNAVRLQQEVVSAVNSAAAELCAAQGRAPEDLLDFCLVGNSAMHHLLARLPVRPLALIPFVPAVSSPLEFEAAQLGLEGAPGANAYLPPPVAGFVGSDHVAFLLAAGFEKDERTRVGIDIGTNTEIALQSGGHLVSCSTASGPAFEGAHIRHGMRAAPGAIERVIIGEDRQVHCDIIGNGPAVGICGSGILDALAELHQAAILNGRGRMNPETPGMEREEDGTLVFPLARGQDGHRDVTISQRDVDQILLAKGAIRAGLDILLNHLGLKADQIEEVVIAGAFGSYLSPRSAIRIGLLPDVPLERVRAVGNAAGAGARLMLASTEARAQARDLARRIEYLELTVVPRFNRYFANAVRLPA